MILNEYFIRKTIALFLELEAFVLNDQNDAAEIKAQSKFMEMMIEQTHSVGYPALSETLRYRAQSGRWPKMTEWLIIKKLVDEVGEDGQESKTSQE